MRRYACQSKCHFPAVTVFSDMHGNIHVIGTVCNEHDGFCCALPMGNLIDGACCFSMNSVWQWHPMRDLLLQFFRHDRKTGHVPIRPQTSGNNG
jgi:hypothetical protein